MQRSRMKPVFESAHSLIWMIALLVAPPAASLGAWGQQTSQAAAKLEVEVLHLGKNSCLPGKIQRPPGQFWLHVINQTGAAQTQFSLAAGAQTAAITPFTKQFTPVDLHWVQLLNLPVGQYVISAPGDVQHVCTITIK